MKPKKIGVFSIDPSNFYQKMANEVTLALIKLGHDAVTSRNPVTDQSLAVCTDKNFDVVLRINSPPPPPELRNGSYRHISWFHDFFPSSKLPPENFQKNDLILTLGDKSVLGVIPPSSIETGSMDVGINPADFEKFKGDINRETKFDFGLVGFIPLVRRWRSVGFDSLIFSPEQANLGGLKYGRFHEISSTIMLILRALVRREFSKFNKKNSHVFKEKVLSFFNSDTETKILEIISNAYSPLTGTLDTIALEKKIRAQLTSNTEYTSRLVDFYCRELPRFMDRYLLVNLALSVSQSVALYGANWDHYPNLCNYHRGIVSELESHKIFRSCRRNLQNNNHGIGIHARTLAVMAAGGFVLTHKSTRDNFAGGILTMFNEGVHFANFDLSSFEETSNFWLSETCKRDLIRREAQKKVLSDCTWDHVVSKQLIKHL